MGFTEYYGIKDKTPIGKRGGLWLYQTPEGKIVGTTDEPTTPGGKHYADLTRKSRGSPGTTGTPYTPAQLEAQRQEKLRLLKQQADAKILREKLERARKEKIESGKISGQISGQVSKTKTIGAPRKIDPYYRTSAFGKEYAKYQTELQEKAKVEGRNVFLSERDSIAESIFGGGQQEIQQTKSSSVTPTITEDKTKFQKVKEVTKDFLFGSFGEQFIGIGGTNNLGIQTGLPKITARQIKTYAQTKGLGGRVVGELIPTTPASVGIIGVSSAIFPALPKIVQLGVGGYIAISEGKKVIDPTLPTEKRIASGIIGGLAGTGTILGSIPYIKGGISKFSPKYLKVKTQAEGFKAIEYSTTTKRVSPEAYAKSLSQTNQLIFGKPKIISGDKNILGVYTEPTKFSKPSITIQKGLRGIQKQETIAHELIHYKTPKTLFKIESVLEIPYKYQPTEKIAYGLEKTYATKGFKLTTTEKVGLILEKAPAKMGVTKGIKLPKTSPLVRGGFGVKPSEKVLFLGKNQKVATSQIGFFKQGKDIILDREFFVTPQEPTLKIAETRLSRLGISDLFKIQKQPQISFGIPKQAQIGIESGAVVSRTGKGLSYQIGKGTELEGIKGIGTKITGVKKIGVTTIKGQRADIYSFISGKSNKILTSSITSSSIPTSRVSGETTLGVVLRSNFLTTRQTPKTSTALIPKTTNILTTTKKTTYPIIPISRIPSPISPPTFIPSPPTTPKTSLSILSPPKPPTTPITPTRRTPTTPTLPPKFPPRKFKSFRLKMKSKRPIQIFKQPTKYQISFTGASLGLKGTGRAPGGLSVRGYLTPQQIKARYPKKPKKIKRLRKDKKRDMLKDMFDL